MSNENDVDDLDGAVKKPHLFKSKAELDGQVDPRIKRGGNPNLNKYNQYNVQKMTNRQIREKEMLGLLRKLKPHVADAIMTAVKIMKNKEAAHSNQLKAATILLQQYKDTVEAVYNKDYDADSGEESQQDTIPVFSLKVVEGT